MDRGKEWTFFPHFGEIMAVGISGKKAELVTCMGERIVDRVEVELPDDYDGDPYGETVPFCVDRTSIWWWMMNRTPPASEPLSAGGVTGGF